MAFAIFFRSWSAPFVFDDVIKIVENPDLRNHSELPGSLVRPYAQPGAPNGLEPRRNDPSRPLVYAAYTALYAWAGPEPTVFRAFNLTLHAGCAVLLAAFLSTVLAGLPPWTGMFAGFIFFASPLTTGTAAYVFSLSDLMGAFFSLLALMLLIRARSGPREIAIALCFVAALASKQSAVALPALLFSADLAFGQRPLRWRLHSLLITLTVIYVFARAALLGGIGDLEGSGFSFAPGEYALAQGSVVWRYVWLALSPLGHTLDHRLMPADIPLWQSLVGLAGSAALAAWACVQITRSERELRALAFAGLAFLLGLAPVSSIVPTVDLMVERRAYLPTAALAMAAALALTRLGSRARVVGALAILGLAAGSAFRLEAYRSPRSVWEESLALYPTSERALNNLGLIDLEEGRAVEAKNRFERLLELYPDKVSALSNLAMLYEDPHQPWRDPERAVALYERALRVSPADLTVTYNLALAHAQGGRIAQAEQLWESIVAKNPRHAPAIAQLGNVALAQGSLSLAESRYATALALDPELQFAKNGLIEAKRRKSER